MTPFTLTFSWCVTKTDRLHLTSREAAALRFMSLPKSLLSETHLLEDRSNGDNTEQLGAGEHTGSMAHRKESKYWFVCDPCGIVCTVMTYILIMYGELVVLIVLAPPFPTLGTFLCVFIFTAFAVLAVASHIKSMITDPVSLPP